jgi:hypothetical protein
MKNAEMSDGKAPLRHHLPLEKASQEAGFVNGQDKAIFMAIFIGNMMIIYDDIL